VSLRGVAEAILDLTLSNIIIASEAKQSKYSLELNRLLHANPRNDVKISISQFKVYYLNDTKN